MFLNKSNLAKATRGGVELSIVVPMYNAGPYLSKCLSSLDKATQHIPSEIILIDDGSTDNTLKNAQRYAFWHPKVQVFEQEHKGAGVARNSAIPRLRGEYLTFVDADDFVKPHLFQTLLEAIKRDGTDMVTSIIERYPQEANDYFSAGFEGLTPGIVHVSQYPQLVHDCLIPGKVIKTSFFREKGLHYSETTWFDDMQIAIALQWEAAAVSYVDTSGYCYRAQPSSISMQTETFALFAEQIEMIRRTLTYTIQNITSEPVQRAVFNKLLFNDVFSYAYAWARNDDDDSLYARLILIKELVEEFEDAFNNANLPSNIKRDYRAARNLDIDNIRAIYNEPPL